MIGSAREERIIWLMRAPGSDELGRVIFGMMITESGLYWYTLRAMVTTWGAYVDDNDLNNMLLRTCNCAIGDAPFHFIYYSLSNLFRDWVGCYAPSR